MHLIEHCNKYSELRKKLTNYYQSNLYELTNDYSITQVVLGDSEFENKANTTTKPAKIKELDEINKQYIKEIYKIRQEHERVLRHDNS